MIPLELEPDDAARREQLLEEGISDVRERQPVWKRYASPDPPPPPATPAEAAAIAIRQFRRTRSRGQSSMNKPQTQTQRNGHAQVAEALPERSRYRGVTRQNSRINPWIAKISDGAGSKSLGAFPTEEEAARAYDAARVAKGKTPVNFPAGASGAPAPAPAAPAPPRRSPRLSPVAED